MKQMIKDALILFAITIISGLLLGAVFQITKEPIALQEQKTKQAACAEVFSAADAFEPVADFDAEKAAAVLADKYPDEQIDEVLAAKASGEQIGYVITVTTHEGFGGDIRFMMGVAPDGTLNGISLLAISETAGLGMQADSVLKPQFANKRVSSFQYTKTGASAENEIDAISGATITTNAVTNGVNAGLYYFYNELEGGAAE